MAAFLLTLVGPSSEPPASVPTSCVHFWPEVTRTERGHDHFVRLVNHCRVPAHCDVSSDSNPKPIRVVVAPRQELRVLVFTNSPEPRFVPRVTCWVPPEQLPLTRG